MKRTFLIPMFLIGFIAFSQIQDTRKSIAMMPPVVKGGGVSYAQMEAIRTYTTKCLSNIDTYGAFANDEIDEYVENDKFQQTGVLSAEKRKKIQEFSGVDIICVLYISIVTDKFLVEADFIEAKTGIISKKGSQLMPRKPNPEIENGCMLLAEQFSPMIATKTVAETHSTESGHGKKPESVSVGGFKGGDYKIGKTEITNQEFVAFLNNNSIGSDGTYHGKKMLETDNPRLKCDGGKWYVVKGYETFPALFVSWYGANECCAWMGGRLPTKAEWVFAAKGGNKTKNFEFAGSNISHDVAWCSSNSSHHAHQVATKKPNELGLYDMSGNAWEWCSDFDDRNKSNKQLCGGSWAYNDTYCHPDTPFNSDPAIGDIDSGFRIVFGKETKK